MGKRERDKGLLGEREVKAIFARQGMVVRGLEGSGDHLVVPGLAGPDGQPARFCPTLHLEVKRQERLALPTWLRQAAAEAPEGVVPVVCFRRSREPWYAVVELERFVEMIG